MAGRDGGTGGAGRTIEDAGCRFGRVVKAALAAGLALAGAASAEHALRALSAGFAPGGDIADAALAASPDGEWIVFDRCDAGVDVCLLGSARRNAGLGAPFVTLTGQYVDASGLRVRIAADGRHVAFEAPTSLGPEDEVWSVPIDGSAPPVRLHPHLSGSETLARYALAQDGSVAVIALDDGAGGGTLFRAPLDGSAAATPIDDGNVARLYTYVAPGGAQHALYLIDSDGDDRLEIRTVDLAGGVPLPLGPAELRAGLDFGSLRIAPDGSRAVFSADNTLAERSELYGLALDGPGALSQLSQIPVVGGDVYEFELSADGARAVFLADAAVDGRFELWSVPIDDSAAPVAVSGTPASTRDVVSFALAGSWAVFLADLAVDDKVELWSAPIDASAAPTRRSVALPAGRDVSSFRIAPNGTRLVYKANLVSEVQSDLHLATVSGLTGHTQLTNLDGGLPAIYTIRDYEISPDSRRLAFDIYPAGGFNATLFEQSLLAPAPIPEIVAVSAGTPALIQDARYLPDSRGLVFAAALDSGDRVEALLADERCFADGFESGDRAAWSLSVP